MSRVRGRVPALLAGVFLLGIVIGLFAASVGPTAGDRAEPARPAGGNGLPWEPLSKPEGELAGLSEILRRGSVARAERLREIERRADDPSETPLARGLSAFAAGVDLLGAGRPDEAAERLRSPHIGATELGPYALLLVARSFQEAAPGRAVEALQRLVEDHPDSVLVDEARLTLGRLLARKEAKEEAAREFRAILDKQAADLRAEALYELAGVLVDLGEKAESVKLLEELYYEIPTHSLSAEAGKRLGSLRSFRPRRSPEEGYRLALGRAEKLFQSGGFREALRVYGQVLQEFPKAADRDLIHLRRGVCQYQRRESSAAEKTLGLVTRAELKPEALYYQAESARRLRKRQLYQKRLQEVLSTSSTSPWAEEALWSLARYHLLEDDTERSLEHFRRLVEEFPRGKYAVQARWEVLWDLYRQGRYSEAAEGFELAAREHPDSEELPRLLYWGARCYESSLRADRAESLYRQVLFGYKNTYYGGKAEERLARLRGEQAGDEAIAGARRGVDLGESLRILRTDRLKRIGQLLAVGFDEEARVEAEEAVAGEPDDSGFLAVAAWIQHRDGKYREAMSTMRRAFPFHVSATGDLLPREVWQILCPLKYGDLIEKYSREEGVDPHLVAGLIRQESSFEARARSRAGALGVMQIMPATGRRLAREYRRRYRTADLFSPEINIQYGTRYLRQVLDRFGGRLDYALASYNAGPHRVKAWTGMDLALDSEEFIEEIPFTETRNYVKLVLRNETLYRRLYRGASSSVE